MPSDNSDYAISRRDHARQDVKFKGGGCLILISIPAHRPDKEEAHFILAVKRKALGETHEIIGVPIIP